MSVERTSVSGEELITSEATQYTFPVREAWFAAYKKGNLRLPQSYIEINIFVGHTVVNDLPPTWQAFNQSALDAAQIVELGQAMNIAHKAYGIPYRFAVPGEERPLPEHIVSSTRLQKQWVDSVRSLRWIILDFIKEINRQRNTPTPENYFDVSGYFSDHPDDLELLQTIFDKAHTIILSAPVTEIGNTYKRKIRRGLRSGRFLRRDTSIEALKGHLKEELLKSFPDLPSSIIGDIITPSY